MIHGLLTWRHRGLSTELGRYGRAYLSVHYCALNQAYVNTKYLDRRSR